MERNCRVAFCCSVVVARRRRRRRRRCRLSLVEKSIQLHETRTRACKREEQSWAVSASELPDAVKTKKKPLFNPFRVRARAPVKVCVCVLVETTLYDKNYKSFLYCCWALEASRRVVASDAALLVFPPSETTLQMRSSHDYTTVACVYVYAFVSVLVCGHVAALQK